MTNKESKKSLSSEIKSFLDVSEDSSVYAKGINFGVFIYVSGDEEMELIFHGKRVQWQDSKVKVLLTFSDATEPNINSTNVA